MKKIILGLLIILCAEMRLAAAEQAITVVSISGKASLVREGKMIQLGRGDAVNPQDTIRTGPGSELFIDLGGISSLRVSENTEMNIAELTIGKKEKGKNQVRSRLNLKRGQVLIDVKPLDDQSSFEIATPASVVGVRGTSLSVSYDGVDYADASCINGVVEVDGQKVQPRFRCVTDGSDISMREIPDDEWQYLKTALQELVNNVEQARMQRLLNQIPKVGDDDLIKLTGAFKALFLLNQVVRTAAERLTVVARDLADNLAFWQDPEPVSILKQQTVDAVDEARKRYEEVFTKTSKTMRQSIRDVHTLYEELEQMINAGAAGSMDTDLLDRIEQMRDDLDQPPPTESVPPRLERIRINDRDLAQFRKDFDYVVTADDLKDNKLLLTVEVSSVPAPAALTVECGGVITQAEKTGETMRDGLMATVWQCAMEIPDHVRNQMFNVYVSGRGPDGSGFDETYDFRFLNTDILNDLPRRIETMFSDMESLYRMQDRFRLSDLIADDCMDKMDIERIIDEGFRELGLIENLRLKAGSITRRPAGAEAKLDWEKTITDRRGERFEAKASAALELKLEGDSLKIVKVTGEMFWKPIAAPCQGMSEFYATAVIRKRPAGGEFDFSFGMENGGSGDIYFQEGDNTIYRGASGRGLIDLGPVMLNQLGSPPPGGYNASVPLQAGSSYWAAMNDGWAKFRILREAFDEVEIEYLYLAR